MNNKNSEYPIVSLQIIAKDNLYTDYNIVFQCRWFWKSSFTVSDHRIIRSSDLITMLLTGYSQRLIEIKWIMCNIPQIIIKYKSSLRECENSHIRQTTELKII